MDCAIRDMNTCETEAPRSVTGRSVTRLAKLNSPAEAAPKTKAMAGAEIANPIAFRTAAGHMKSGYL